MATKASTDKPSDTIDVGIIAGLKSLWKDNLFFDYTIQVGDKQFRAHKVVLTSVSEYFRIVLSGSLSEKFAEKIELKGYMPQSVSQLLEVIYTGNKDLITTNAAELLDVAGYLQIPSIIEACVDKLKYEINETNCFDMLLKFKKYAHQEDIDKAKRYINSRWNIIVKKVEMKKLPIETILVIVEIWEHFDWGLFEFAQNWISFDLKNRKKHTDDIMSQIRFCLISESRLISIKSMKLFKQSKGSWKELVRDALKYHKLPIHQKIIHDPVQSGIRGEATPVIFFTRELEYHYYDPQGDWWYDGKYKLGPVMHDFRPVLVEVNNFLIICTVGPVGRRWFVYDPRNRVWEMISKMLIPRRNFALVHHDDNLYGLGGDLGKAGGKDILCNSMEQYTFKDNKWQEFGEMPYAVKSHAACVLSDTIYISGGVLKQDMAGGEPAGFVDTPKVECLDIHTGIWESKAPLLKPLKGHKMHAMKVNGQDMVLAIDPHLHIQSYNPSSNQWSYMKVPVNDQIKYPDICKASVVIPKGNTIYFLNYGKPCEDYVSTDEDDIPDEDMEDVGKRIERCERRRQRKVLTCPMISDKSEKPEVRKAPVICDDSSDSWEDLHDDDSDDSDDDDFDEEDYANDYDGSSFELPHYTRKGDPFSLKWEVLGQDTIKEIKMKKYHVYNDCRYDPEPRDGYAYGCMITRASYSRQIDPEEYDEEEDDFDGYIHIRF